MRLKLYNPKSTENLSAINGRKNVVMYSVRCILTIIMLFVATIGNASGVDVERLINSFDGRHNQVEIANSFFKERVSGFSRWAHVVSE